MLDQENINKLMKQAQNMQHDLEKAQKKLSELLMEATSNDKMVRIVISGTRELKRIYINPAISNNHKLMEENIMSAVNAALKKVDKISSAKMLDYLAALTASDLTGLNN